MTNPLIILPMCANAWDQENPGPRENAFTLFTGMCSGRDTFITLLPPTNPWFDMTALIALVNASRCIPVPVIIEAVTNTGLVVKVQDGFTVLAASERAVIPVDPTTGIIVSVFDKARIDRVCTTT